MSDQYAPSGDEGRRLRVLVVNDDGIRATGISVLAHAAADLGLEVVVVAPLHERSGASAGLDATQDGDRLRIHEAELAPPGAPDAPRSTMAGVVAVEASPAFIVMTALRGAFGTPPDLVLSGVNHGPNTGAAVLHSGTVGAAMTAFLAGVPAMAVSLRTPDPASDHEAGAEATPQFRTGADDGATGGGTGDPDAESSVGATGRTDRDEEQTGTAEAGPASRERVASPQTWAQTRRAAAAALRWLLDHRDAPGVLNLNLPALDRTTLRGVRPAPLASFGAVQAAVQEGARGFVRIGFTAPDASQEPESDAGLLDQGWATLTVIRPASGVDEVDLTGVDFTEVLQG